MSTPVMGWDGKPCNATSPSIYHDGEQYVCRCLVCGRCGKHTGNSSQGHYWKWCMVTGTMRTFHFCCPGDCELEKHS
jgi:hypothetical protein